MVKTNHQNCICAERDKYRRIGNISFILMSRILFHLLSSSSSSSAFPPSSSCFCPLLLLWLLLLPLFNFLYLSVGGQLASRKHKAFLWAGNPHCENELPSGNAIEVSGRFIHFLYLCYSLVLKYCDGTHSKDAHRFKQCAHRHSHM